MRFMIMHKVTDEMERGGPPDQATIEGVGKLVEEGARDGIFLSGEGLKPTSARVHIVYRGGERTVTEGPFTDPRELVAGYALMAVKSRDEAIAWCDRFADAIGDVELYMGPVVENWDLGFGEKPADAPMRFLSMHKLDERVPEGPPDPALMAKMGALIEEMTAAGVLQATGGLERTHKGARIRYDGGRRTVIDGPFAESKELVAGYAMVELPSLAAAIEWTKRFGEVVKVNEIEIRELAAR